MLQYVPVLSAYDTGNGVCRYLVNNLCGIYENRPQICKVEEMYFTFFKDVMTEQEFVKANIEACAKIADYFAEGN
jgi:Fe-S-cluster containining protein